MPDQERLNTGLELLRDLDASEGLAARHVPGLVLASRHDPLVPVAASEALAASAKTVVAWHEQGGHLLSQSDPVWCAQQIARFLDENFSSSTRIIKRFESAAHHYDAAATMQATVAAQLVEQSIFTNPPRQILDVGCGTGLVSAAISATLARGGHHGA